MGNRGRVASMQGRFGGAAAAIAYTRPVMRRASEPDFSKYTVADSDGVEVNEDLGVGDSTSNCRIETNTTESEVVGTDRRDEVVDGHSQDDHQGGVGNNMAEKDSTETEVENESESEPEAIRFDSSELVALRLFFSVFDR